MELSDELRARCDELVPPGSAVTDFHNTADWMKMKVLTKKGLSPFYQNRKKGTVPFFVARGSAKMGVGSDMRVRTTIMKLVANLTVALAAASAVFADAPVLTDEFDAFLVTADTEIGEVVGVIRPVFENPKKITYELIPPVPGGDRRGYLKARPARRDRRRHHRPRHR